MTGTIQQDDPFSVGVIGVGSMGRHHARVYDELASAELVGVADADEETARTLANEYRTAAMDADELLQTVDAVSVAVPTSSHYAIAREAIERDVAVLVEKPFVEKPSHGRDLVDRARRRDVPLQVGHVERFNPAVRAARDVIDELELIGVCADRLGPPVDRDITDDAVLDLMIHDIDLLLSIVDAPVESVDAVEAGGDPFIVATIRFENGVLGRLTASRVTQEKVRHLTMSARECRVIVDYLDQSVAIHRDSMPAYVESDDGLRYRHSSVTEELAVEGGEPLRNELQAFLGCVATASDPPVTGEDGLRALELARTIVEEATSSDRSLAEVHR
jgi:predicted dehydrogenase